MICFGLFQLKFDNYITFCKSTTKTREIDINYPRHDIFTQRRKRNDNIEKQNI